MGVYKDDKTASWFCKFYFKDWQGDRHQTTKRGFKTKKDALRWQADFIAKENRSMHISFEAYVKIYFEDKKNKLKERTVYNKKYMIDKHILPYFKNKKVDEVTSSDIIQWQNAMEEKGYSQTYLRMVQNQLTALYTHAAKIYGLKNPCVSVEKMGKSDADHIDFWTKEEYDRFISVVDKSDKYYVLFELLFWTGIRIGEALALTISDFDFDRKELRITKTYYRLERKDIITAPKTENSIRSISMPDFLLEEVKDYYNRLYKYPRNERLFPVVPKAVENKFKRDIEKAGVKRIRIHDLRHSHASYLIDRGVDAMRIKERLGHKDIKITLNTYGHLYPNKQRELANMLDAAK